MLFTYEGNMSEFNPLMSPVDQVQLYLIDFANLIEDVNQLSPDQELIQSVQKLRLFLQNIYNEEI